MVLFWKNVEKYGKTAVFPGGYGRIGGIPHGRIRPDWGLKGGNNGYVDCAHSKWCSLMLLFSSLSFLFFCGIAARGLASGLYLSTYLERKKTAYNQQSIICFILT